MLLRPGSLVVPRGDVDCDLVLWESPRSSIDDDVGKAKPDELLLIVKARKTRKPKNEELLVKISNEWSEGSYMVLTSTGACGWIGAGWVVQVF